MLTRPVPQHGPSLRFGRAREFASHRSVSLDVPVNDPGRYSPVAFIGNSGSPWISRR
jgi:hypothetical protein